MEHELLKVSTMVLTRVKTLLLSSLTLSALGISARPAAAQHDIRVFLSEGGVEFVEKEAPSFIPAVLEPPDFAKSFGCMDFEQRDTVVNISMDDLDIDMPDDGRIRATFDISIAVNGELYADDLYACFGEVTCQDSITLDRGSVVIDMDLVIVDGQPKVSTREVALSVDPEDFDLSLEQCGFTGSALTTAFNFAEGWILDFAEKKVSDLAEENLAPMLEKVLSGLSMDGPYVQASVKDLYFPKGGVSLRVDAGLQQELEAAECVRAFDKGAPKPEAGDAAPDLTGPGADQVNVAVNLGLLNQALYTAWHRGLLCVTDEHLASLGVEVDLSMVGPMLPGFPPGTEFSLQLRFTDYPRVKGEISESASLTLVLSGLELDLHGDRPDGSRNTLHAELNVEVSARIATDPASNAIFVKLAGVEIKEMLIEDERAATGEGFDVARIKQLVHEAILPKILGELAPIPVTGSVFAVQDFAVILRSLRSNKAYLSAGVDLFRAPKNDSSAPETEIVSTPAGVINPHHAVIRVGGSDSQIPSELLQYLVTVDGQERPLSFLRDVHIGDAGRTASYAVSVAAVDLAGNVDPSPATTNLMVDGMVPFVMVSGSRNRSAGEGPIELSWNMDDDLTAPELLNVRVEIYDLEDPADVPSARLLEVQELPPGTTNTVLELAKVGGVYRVEIHAVDEAGNDSQSSLLLSIASTGGCSLGGGGNSGGTLIVLVMGILSLRRRRRHL